MRLAAVSGIAVDEVDEAVADALDRRDVELHRAHRAVVGLGAQLERALVGLRGVLHADGEGARRRPVHARERLREAVGLAVHDEVDAPLAVERHVLGAVPRHEREAHLLEERAQELAGSGAVYSMNSKPSVPMGLSARSGSVMAVSSARGGGTGEFYAAASRNGIATVPPVTRALRNNIASSIILLRPTMATSDPRQDRPQAPRPAAEGRAHHQPRARRARGALAQRVPAARARARGGGRDPRLRRAPRPREDRPGPARLRHREAREARAHAHGRLREGLPRLARGRRLPRDHRRHGLPAARARRGPARTSPAS